MFDCYCELMGVSEVSELPSNYISENVEGIDNNKNIIRVNSCYILSGPLCALQYFLVGR